MKTKNKFANLSPITKLTIMDTIFKLSKNNTPVKSIQQQINSDFGYKLKVKTINNLSKREENFTEFENLLTQKNLIY
jgi:hypothetical protein